MKNQEQNTTQPQYEINTTTETKNDKNNKQQLNDNQCCNLNKTTNTTKGNYKQRKQE
jgi:hypothetical protein